MCILLRAASGDGQIELSVRDNGKGVPEEQQEIIWHYGYSEKKSSGLGLAFVKMVVERSGGTISMQSKWQEGTTISILLPEEGDKTGDGK